MNRKHIHEDNIEAFLLDAMEGRLDASDREALAAFLEDNPSWKAELDGATLYYIVQPPVVVFPDKESLKKQQRGGIILNILSSPLWRKVAVAALIAGIAFA